MKTNNFDLKDLSVSHLTTEEKVKITGGSGASWSAGWLIGAAFAMPVLLLAAGVIAVASIINTSGGYRGGSMT